MYEIIVSTTQPPGPINGSPGESAKDSPSIGRADYRIATHKEDESQKRMGTENNNVRNKVWMSRDVSTYSNSGYVFATSPIDLSMFRGKRGREIATSHPLSMMFAILTRCLNTTEVDNYFARSEGQWFGLDTAIKGPPPYRL